MELAEGFTDEQRELWERYAEARERADDAEVALGFQWVCDLEVSPLLRSS
jgi:hypothetical protein